MPRREYSFEQRKKVIELYKKGETPTLIKERTGIPLRTQHGWILDYEKEGLEALDLPKSTFKRVPLETKENAVRACLENKLTVREAARLYGVGKSTLQGWISLVKKHGYPELAKPHARGYRLKQDMDCYRARKPVISESARPFLNGAINDTIKLMKGVNEVIQIAKKGPLNQKELASLTKVENLLTTLSDSSINNLQKVYMLSSGEAEVIRQFNKLLPKLLGGVTGEGSRATKKK